MNTGTLFEQMLDENSVDLAQDDKITRFLRATGAGARKIDPIDWWKNQEDKFPTLSKVTRDVLSIQASSVASESTFSHDGRLVTDYRTRLSDGVIQACVLLNSWSKL